VIEGEFGAVNIIGFVVLNMTHVPVLFLTATLYVPGARPEKVPLFDQFVPPSIEYCKLIPVAVTVIAPSLTPQFDGSIETTLLITGT